MTTFTMEIAICFILLNYSATYKVDTFELDPAHVLPVAGSVITAIGQDTMLIRDVSLMNEYVRYRRLN